MARPYSRPTSAAIAASLGVDPLRGATGAADLEVQ
jgi:hypothetical protein